jgi:PAS domain S-box-containing protein
MKDSSNGLQNNARDAFLISDAKGKILYVNTAIENVTGLKAEIHLGKNIQELIKDRLITHSATFDAVRQQKAVRREVNTIAGKKLLSTASPVFNSKGRINRVVCNIKDITDYHQLNNLQTELRMEPLNPLNNETISEVIKFGREGFEIAFASKAMSSLIQLAIHLGTVDTSVMITGETGVGKDLIARLIHNSSPRSQRGAFVKVNCASLSENLFESELFGYIPGSFTGALKSGKTGYIEKANNGTLFIDEVAELSLNQQAKLLSVLQDRELFKVGSTSSRPLDLRIIAASNCNLEKLVAEGKFRKDLYYRLNVISLKVLPLRERKEDIPVLVGYFKKILENKYGIHKEICREVNNFFLSHPWPGNVRELSNLVENLLISVPHKTIDISCIPDSYVGNLMNDFLYETDIKGTLRERVSKFETAVINKTLEQCATQEEAARKLGISRSSLVRKINLSKK